MTRRGRVVMGIGSVAIAAAALLLFLPHASGIVIPDDACASPPPLTTYRGVTLQPLAMVAFKKAEQTAGQRIPVVWSYRSCAQQRVVCQNICGSTQCPGRCASPGTSWHQMGAAIDTNQHGLDTPAVVDALRANGWCEPLPSSDPGHFSFGGCH
jgi:D-alanyl-D-alanine carboxypeptidase